eukprot:CAMPEP_0170563104 /NCGR_PEP_ID=MMETSP0211-20121228/64353_1 /TAXON_ID=311385 /ORGANISM="Pseudokeronopsis sp., Strain OXSARD2" /LENGTH=73 /DNA_ID=CAMNT_0010880883 /DNA_START=393 /DNA_END=614 /DNA_ORIENTATION=+
MSALSESDSSEDERKYSKAQGTVNKQKLHNFISLLQEILNPADEEGLQMDSVYQLKKLVRGYYEKKNEIQTNL